jgi:hypothetical protein
VEIQDFEERGSKLTLDPSLQRKRVYDDCCIFALGSGGVIERAPSAAIHEVRQMPHSPNWFAFLCFHGGRNDRA